ncbi:MAG: sialidase family protein [Bacteroidia bacterium]|nr:sialidase family protein [Bacteroidia bacterium]
MKNLASLLSAICLLAIACEPQKQNIYPLVVHEFIYETAPFPSCHASTLAQLPDGQIVAAWFGGTHEKHPDVGIWFSRKEREKWTVPTEVANGLQSDTLRYPCWNPVLFQPASGPLQLYYKVGPSPSEWWGMLITSADGGKTWSAPTRLPEGILGPIKNKPIALSDGTIISPSSDEAGEKWTAHVEISPDGGNTWTRTAPVNNPYEVAAIQPTILTFPDGSISMLCRTQQGKVGVSNSSDKGQTWTPMVLTDIPNPNAGIDGITLQDGRHLLVYNPTTPPPGEWGGPRTPLVVGISEDGISWTEWIVLEFEEGEYSYPAVIQGSDGKIHITYTWKREKIKYAILNLK